MACSIRNTEAAAELRESGCALDSLVGGAFVIGCFSFVDEPQRRAVILVNFEQLAEAFRLKVERARSGSLRTEDLSGGTFTITNVGSNGNLASMPLINQPQVGILAIGAIKKRVVVITDSWGTDAMAIRPMMYMTLTYDHRANDGAASGRFLRELRKTIELWPPGSEESGS